MTARVAILADPGAPDYSERQDSPPEEFAAELAGTTEPRLDIHSTRSVPPGVSLRVITREAILLGDAESCSGNGNGYTIVFRPRHVLRDFETLRRLADRFGVDSLKELLSGLPE